MPNDVTSKKRPVYLCELYAVTEKKARQGWGAIVRLESGTRLHCSRMADDTIWFIDSMFRPKGEDVLTLHNNGFGERRQDRAELFPLHLGIGIALDRKLEEHGLLT